MIKLNWHTSKQWSAIITSPARELFLEPHWYACRTRARAEKQVNARLERSGFETYLPLVEKIRQWADRRKRVALPLLPGYTFARFTLADTLQIVQTPGLVNVLSGSGRGHPTPVRDEELEAVRILVDGIGQTGEEPQVTDWIENGTPVQVLEGPFRGMQGVLLEVCGRSRVSVQLTGVQLGVSVEIDSASLRPLASDIGGL